MTDIRNGINAGKTVTVHDTQINFNGWSGTGYTILDPNSGAGAYMIGGGLDGGFINTEILENIIQWLSAFEVKAVKPLKAIISQVKKVFQNLKAVVDIVKECNAGLALLGVIIYLATTIIAAKVITAIGIVAGTIGSAACGLFCGAAATLFIVPSLVAIVNSTQEIILNDILTGCRGN